MGSLLLLISYLMIMLVAALIPSGAEENNVVLIAILSGALLAGILHWAANIQLSREDRSPPFRWIPFLHRWSLRIVPLPCIIGIVLTIIIVTNFIPFPAISNFLLAGFSLTLLLCPTLSFFRLRTLALRLSRPRLAEHITIVATGFSISLIWTIIGFAFGEFRHADAWFYLCNVIPLSLVGLFYFWSVLLLFFITPRFFRSARTAKVKWMAADASRTPEGMPAVR